MMQLTYQILKPLLLKLNPEVSHALAIRSLRFLPHLPLLSNVFSAYYSIRNPRLQQNILNLSFQNPIGLAAGFDKDAEAIKTFSAIGFGFVEVGTVTRYPQKGNPRPRLFRYPKYESLQNAMGFNNAGVSSMLDKLKKSYPLRLPLGVNIGKNKDSPLDKSLEEYTQLLQSLQHFCDYFVINLSSPNTPGLRSLQNQQFVERMFLAAVELTEKPVFLKVSPDEEIHSLLDLAEAAVKNGASGIIATNTSTDYGLIPNSRAFGGLSGTILRKKSFAVLQGLAKKFYGRTILISVGGIDSGREAYRRLKEGASLVQVYTGLIYNGPGLIRKINNELLELLDRDGFTTITEAVGRNQPDRPH